ncbi:hydrolase [Streptomyces sp. JNUCC 63]
MQSPHLPRPPHPPHSGTTPGESDRGLVARLRDPEGGHHAVAPLLARHWRATYDYAAICLTAQGSSAAMVATAAFRQVLRRPEGGALRPQLLVAAREVVREWAGDETACAVLPELSRPTGGRGLRAVASMTPPKRQLADRAFQALPGAFQCLLWHTEVEAEPITVPAGLLAIDADTAKEALRRAREQFRAGCVRAHRELAPTKECRFYNRLLDAPVRRGGALLSDAQPHSRACPHCRHAAEQLSHFDGGLEVLLTETVLGWGARRYLDSRPARAPRRASHEPPYETRPDPLHRYRTALALGVGLTTLALLATVLVVKGWTDDHAVPGPRANGGTHSTGSARPGVTDEPSPAVSAAFGPRPSEVTHGRPVQAGEAAPEAGEPCRDATSPQPRYETRGHRGGCLTAGPHVRKPVAGHIVGALASGTHVRSVGPRPGRPTR